MNQVLFNQYLDKLLNASVSTETVSFEQASREQQAWLNQLTYDQRQAYEAACFVSNVIYCLNIEPVAYYNPYSSERKENAFVFNELAKRYQVNFYIDEHKTTRWKISRRN